MKRDELVLVVLVLATAALLRLLWLDRIPGGWHHDEGLMGVMAGEVLRGENRPIFFSAYLGQEPLYIYLGALAMAFLGEEQSILALRLISALLGTATVGATYLLGREWFGRRVALVAAALLAISFWHLLFSRDGYRAIAQPLLETLSLYLLWAGAQRRSWPLSALSGLLFGGVVYTYLAGRAFLLIWLPFGLWWLITRGLPRDTLKPIAIFAGVAFITMAPLALFFLANPDLFTARTEQMSPIPLLASAESWGQMARNILTNLGMFTFAGDPLWRFNIPGRPVFSWFWAPFFYLGLAAVAWRAWRGQAAATLLLSWLLVMVTPAALSYEKELVPNSIRTLGLLGALYLVPALGLVDLGNWLGQRLGGWRRVGLAATGLFLLAEGVLNVNAYFGLWANHIGTAIETGEDVVAGARYLEKEAQERPVKGFFSSVMYPHPVVKQLAPKAYPGLRWFDGNQSLVLPPPGDETQTYVFPYEARLDDLLALLPTEARVAEEYFDEGPARFVAFALPPEGIDALRNRLMTEPGFRRLSISLGGEVEILGYRLGPRVEAGGKLPLTLIWQVLRESQPRDYVFFSHLIDDEGGLWGQGDVNGFPTPEWRPGDLVVGRYDLAVRDDTPNGAYQVWVGAYDRRTLERLPLPDGAQGLKLGRVRGVESRRGEVAIPQRVEASFELGIALEGFALERRDDQLELTLYWRGAQPLSQDFTVFVQLLDGAGRLATQDDSPPAQGRLPTSFWEAGELVADTHHLALTSLPPGRYQVIAGLYRLESGQRLKMVRGQDYLSIASLDLNP